MLRTIHPFHRSFSGRMVLLGSLVGIVGGTGAVVFRYMIRVFTWLFFGAESQAVLVESVVALPWYYRVLAPAIGGAMVGVIVRYGGGASVSGHGVPEVMAAMQVKQGHIPVRVAPAKALASAVCIGSGGATGREGPIVQIGATFGSVVGQRLDLSEDQTKILLSAGAAAGIGGTFNAPLGGMIFAWEVLLGKVTRPAILPIVLGSLIGTAFANIMLGLPDPVFTIPAVSLASWLELIAFAVLGILCAVVALAYTNTLYAIENIFDRLPVGVITKPAIGGLCLGVLALSFPQVHATGYPVIQDALSDAFPIEMVVLLAVAKIVATSLTLGSGGSGGIFAPALFIGAMVGSAYGKVVFDVFPHSVAGPTPYAAVGMGAVFAGSAHAPLTAIVIIAEMTGNVIIVGPLLVACLLSSRLSRRVRKQNIYTTELIEQGVDIEPRRLI